MISKLSNLWMMIAIPIFFSCAFSVFLRLRIQIIFTTKHTNDTKKFTIRCVEAFFPFVCLVYFAVKDSDYFYHETHE